MYIKYITTMYVTLECYGKLHRLTNLYMSCAYKYTFATNQRSLPISIRNYFGLVGRPSDRDKQPVCRRLGLAQLSGLFYCLCHSHEDIITWKRFPHYAHVTSMLCWGRCTCTPVSDLNQNVRCWFAFVSSDFNNSTNLSWGQKHRKMVFHFNQ